MGIERKVAPATPRWVRIFRALGIFLVVLLVVLHLTGHGFGHCLHTGVH